MKERLDRSQPGLHDSLTNFFSFFVWNNFFDMFILLSYAFVSGETFPRIEKRFRMTGKKVLEEIVLNNEKFKLVGECLEKNGRDVVIYIAPEHPVMKVSDLEKDIEEMFVGIPEITSIVYVDSGAAMMPCNERLSGKDQPEEKRTVTILCYTDITKASDALALSSR